MPVESHPLQAWVSEPMKPILDTVVMSNAVHGYVSQSDKGELVIGAGIDSIVGYSQRGSLHTVEHATAACPIHGETPVKGLFMNCGWGTGGFKATPGSGWAMAYTLAKGEPHELNAPFALERFQSGALVDEHGAAGVAH